MIITAWILLVFFGVFSLWTAYLLYKKRKTLGWLHSILWFFSAFITAISAGIIWGGLLS